MATDPKWAALRAWLRDGQKQLPESNAPEYLAELRGRAQQCGATLAEMTRLSRQRPKTGAKKR